MGTRFELLLESADHEESELRAAAEEAFFEIREAEERLSLFRRGSHVARLNTLAHQRPIAVDQELFELLLRCQELWRATSGAFDISVGPLMEHYGFRGATPRPDREAARAATGLDGLELDASRGQVRFHRPGMQLDLGGVGKGFAMDLAFSVLQEAEIPNVFLHGGTSSVKAAGRAPGGGPWTVAVPLPGSGAERRVTLCDRSLGVSAPHGRTILEGTQERTHVLDPRAGEPVQGALLAAAVAASALEADAWSTALLVLAAEDPSALARTLEHGSIFGLVSRLPGEPPRILGPEVANGAKGPFDET